MLDAALQSLANALVHGAAAPVDATMLALARRHRVDRLVTAGDPRLRGETHLALAASLSSERDIVGICDAAARSGIDLLLMKGAALAYTHYPAPHLRPRDDIDVLIRRDDRERASTMLQALGYEREADGDAELWNAQHHYVRTTAAGVSRIDVHWRAANPVAFARALPFDDVLPRSVPVAALGRHARTLAPVDALALACLHRVAHHQDAIELLWVWDIHLLASQMSADEFALLESTAADAGTARVCARGLSLSQECFGTIVPADVLRRLESAVEEPSAAFVGAKMRPVDVARADLAALTTWRQRAGLLREHLFPPAEYMRRRFPRCPSVLLPLAYVQRIVQGAPRWIRR